MASKDSDKRDLIRKNLTSAAKEVRQTTAPQLVLSAHPHEARVGLPSDKHVQRPQIILLPVTASTQPFQRGNYSRLPKSVLELFNLTYIRLESRLAE